MPFLIIAAVAFMILGFCAYNPLRRKYAGTIGVGGSYLVLLGIMLLASSVGQIIGTVTGESNVSALEIILGVIVMILCLGYMVYVMPVSYTHLDVYKRQPLHNTDRRCREWRWRN